MNLMGHSWGGLLAMFYAIKHPDRLHSLILCNSSPASSSFRMASFRIMQERTTRNDSLAQAAITQTEGFRERDPRVMEKFFRLLFRSGFADPRYADSVTLTLPNDYGIRSKYLNYLSKDPVSKNYDITEKLKLVRCPVLIVGASADFVPEEANAKIAATIPGSRLLTLEHCGHFPFVEQPAEFNAAIRDFLSTTQQADPRH